MPKASKIAANKIQQHNKNVIRHDQVGFTAGLQGAAMYDRATWYITVTGENHVIISGNGEKAFG